MKPIHSRLAPTPSGYLHLGNILNFLITWSLVRKSGGTLTLRIDDCDRRRIKAHYIDDIFKTLKWLGVDWDLGPQSIDEFENHYSQVKNKARYWSYLSQVDHYCCDCSRREIKARGKLDGYDGFCKQRALKFSPEVTAVRFCSAYNDFLLWTKDNHPAYQLVSVVDDLEGNINLIIRGDDLVETTSMQQELSSAIGKKLPNVLFHKLLLGSEGEKLSKSYESQSVRSLRENGMSKEDVFQELSKHLGFCCSTLEGFKNKIDFKILRKES